MKNKKSKLRSNPIMRGRQGNWHMYKITILLFLILLSLPAVNAKSSDSGTNWDKPFDKPMWLLHTEGGEYYDEMLHATTGIFSDDKWILYPNRVESIDDIHFSREDTSSMKVRGLITP